MQPQPKLILICIFIAPHIFAASELPSPVAHDQLTLATLITQETDSHTAAMLSLPSSVEVDISPDAVGSSAPIDLLSNAPSDMSIAQGQESTQNKKRKYHACTQCEKSFDRSADLKNHGVVHTLAKPVQCKRCGDTFRQKSGLFAHQNGYYKKVKTACTCNDRFQTRCDLVMHQKECRIFKETAPQNHQCACGQILRHKNNLPKHLQTALHLRRLAVIKQSQSQ